MKLSPEAIEQLDIQGHRGAAGLKPENTLPSFEAALDLGVDTLELDVLLSNDDQVIVWHDPYLVAGKCRLPSGETRLPQPNRLSKGDSKLWIRNLTADQLAGYQCDGIPDSKSFPGKNNKAMPLAGVQYHIVTLSELFAFIETYAESSKKTGAQRQSAREVRINIETKRDPKHAEYVGDGFNGTDAGILERKIVELVQTHELQKRVVIQSFDIRSVRAVGRLDESLELAVLEGKRRVGFNAMHRWGVSTWSPKHGLVERRLVDEAHDYGLKVIPWTVNKRAAMQRLIEMGVDGLITDRPDLLLEAR
ncbi:MAG: glycerophosphodiester phosphodiesterase family protein [Persicimonas sp.]